MLGYNRSGLFIFGIYAPLLLSKAAIVVVAPLCVLLGGSKQLSCLLGILLEYRSVAHLALEEVFELIPVGLFAIERERVLAFFLEFGVITPQMPVATFHSLGFLGLALGYPNSYCRDYEANKVVLGCATNALWGGNVVRDKKIVDDLREVLLGYSGCPAGFWPEGSKAHIYSFCFSWAAMGRTNRPDRMGFNIGVQDDDAGGRRDHTLYWTGDPKRPYANESAFGTLVFDGPIIQDLSDISRY